MSAFFPFIKNNMKIKQIDGGTYEVSIKLHSKFEKKTKRIFNVSAENELRAKFIFEQTILAYLKKIKDIKEYNLFMSFHCVNFNK